MQITLRKWQKTDAAELCRLGYWLGQAFWGKGAATEAVRQMCVWGFAQWDIVRIFAAVFADNHASCRVLEKTALCARVHCAKALSNREKCWTV